METGLSCGSRRTVVWAEAAGDFSEAASRGLLEFLFKAEYAYDMGMPQWMARVDHAFSACISNVSSSGGTRSSISGSGTGMPSLGTFGKCCLTRAVFRGPILTEKALRPWYRVILREPELHHRASQTADPGTPSPPLRGQSKGGTLWRTGKSSGRPKHRSLRSRHEICRRAGGARSRPQWVWIGIGAHPGLAAELLK